MPKDCTQSWVVLLYGFIPVLAAVCLLSALRFLRVSFFFFTWPEAKAVQHPLKDRAAPPDEDGPEVSTKQGRPLSPGSSGTPTDENAIKTNRPAERLSSPVSLLITCSKASDPVPPHPSAPAGRGTWLQNNRKPPQSFSSAHPPFTFCTSETVWRQILWGEGTHTHSSKVWNAEKTTERSRITKTKKEEIKTSKLRWGVSVGVLKSVKTCLKS